MSTYHRSDSHLVPFGTPRKRTFTRSAAPPLCRRNSMLPRQNATLPLRKQYRAILGDQNIQSQQTSPNISSENKIGEAHEPNHNALPPRPHPSDNSPPSALPTTLPPKPSMSSHHNVAAFQSHQGIIQRGGGERGFWPISSTRFQFESLLAAARVVRMLALPIVGACSYCLKPFLPKNKCSASEFCRLTYP